MLIYVKGKGVLSLTHVIRITETTKILIKEGIQGRGLVTHLMMTTEFSDSGKSLPTPGRRSPEGAQGWASMMTAGATEGLSGWGWSLATATVRDVIQGREAY